MASAAKSPKITAFFKPAAKEVVEKDAEKENSSIVVNSNEQIVSGGGTKRKHEGNHGDGGEGGQSAEQKSKGSEKGPSDELIKLAKELSIVTSDIGPSWFEALRDSVFSKDWFRQLDKFVSGERGWKKVHPGPGEVWSWTRAVDIRSVKVVILGQDPYHGPGQAHGLCFSVLPGVPPPPSLVNIYKELERDPGVAGFESRPEHGHLAGWAAQGVLLLNAVLTVRQGEANSHKGQGWEKVTDAVISWISRNLAGVVFLLWGSHAQKKAAMVDRSKHHLLTSVHPSPLSAHKGFLGCGHFSRCNELLEAAGRDPVDWAQLPLHSADSAQPPSAAQESTSDNGDKVAQMDTEEEEEEASEQSESRSRPPRRKAAQCAGPSRVQQPDSDSDDSMSSDDEEFDPEKDEAKDCKEEFDSNPSDNESDSDSDEDIPYFQV